MKKVLVVLGHSNFENSLANKTIANTLDSIENVTVRNLSDVSDNFKFDVAAEQAAMEAADVVVFQFPFHWYSVPALFKKWIDDVILHGWAYGEGGDKLKGKKLIVSPTTGAPEGAYASGAKGSSVEEFMAPLKATAGLCGMELVGIKPVYGMMYIPGFAGDKEDVSSRAKAHGEELLKLIETL